MKKRKMSLLIVFLLLSTALLSGEANYAYASNEKTNPQTATNAEYAWKGWADVILWEEALAYDGSGWAQWNYEPMEVTLPITSVTNDGKALIQGEEVYTYLSGSGVLERGGIVLTSYIGWMAKWEISGILYPAPDCSLELFIDEYWFAGFVIGCGPFVGCVVEPSEPEHHPGIVVKIPHGTGYGYIDFENYGANLSGRLHAFLINQATSDPACDYHQFMP